MINYSIKIVCLFIACLAPFWLSAAGDIGIRVLALDQLPEGVQAELQGGRADANFPYLSISQQFFLETGSNLEFYLDLPESEEPDSPLRTVKIGTVNIPSGAGPFLIVLRFNPAAALPSELVQGKVFLEDSETFPPGSIQVINLCRETIATRISAEDAVIKPYEAHLFFPDLQKRFRYRVEAAVEDGGSWEVLHRGVASMQAGSRVYCFAIFDRHGMRHLYSEMQLERDGDPAATFFWLRVDDIPPALPSAP